MGIVRATLFQKRDYLFINWNDRENIDTLQNEFKFE